MLKSFVSATAIAVSLSPVGAFAENAAETREDPIVVTASRSGDGVPVHLLGSSVTVINDKELENRQIRVISDVLRDVPGVAVNRAGNIGGLTQVRVRGAEGDHVLVLIDGIKASDPYYGEYDFGTLIADDSARLEVLRGQQSSLYGSDAIGGVIQYTTLSGKEAPGISIRAEGGSFGTASTAARIADVSGDFDYAVSGSYYHTNGTPTARGGKRKVGSDSVGVSFKTNWTPAPNFKLTAVGRYSFTNADTNNSDYNPASPTFGYVIDTPGWYYKNSAFYGLLRGELLSFDDKLTTALSAQFADTTRNGYKAGNRPDYGDKGRRYKGSFENSYRFGSDNVKNVITVAVDAEREEYRNTLASAGTFNGLRHVDNIGLVGQYELTVNDTLAIGASLRRDENTRFDDTTTWRVQGSYSFDFGTRIRAASGSGVKNPGFYQLYGYSDGRYIGNPNLKPEKSQGWEAGIEQSISGDKAVIGVTYFDNVLRDEIFTRYPAPTFIATPGNRTTKSKQHGLEAFVTATPVPQIQVNLTYTYLKARENGQVEVRRPKHMGSLNVTYTSLDQKFSTTLTARYNGRMTDVAYTDPSYVPVRVSMQEFVLVNFAAEYKVTDTVSVYGRVENLINEKYEELFGYATSGRGAYAGIRAKF